MELAVIILSIVVLALAGLCVYLFSELIKTQKHVREHCGAIEDLVQNQELAADMLSKIAPVVGAHNRWIIQEMGSGQPDSGEKKPTLQ